MVLRSFINSDAYLICITIVTAANGDLKDNAITMSDTDRAMLMEKFKNHELSEAEVLSKVCN